MRRYKQYLKNKLWIRLFDVRIIGGMARLIGSISLLVFINYRRHSGEQDMKRSLDISLKAQVELG